MRVDHFGRNRFRARRCCLVGRPEPGSRRPATEAPFVCRGSRLGAGGDRSSYKACASGAGPRRTPSSKSLTTRTLSALGKVRTSPARRLWCAFLMISLFTRSRPDCTKRVAMVRLLKKRANHSHRSKRRTSSLRLILAGLKVVRPRVLQAWQRVNLDLLSVLRVFAVRLCAPPRAFGGGIWTRRSRHGGDSPSVSRPPLCPSCRTRSSS